MVPAHRGPTGRPHSAWWRSGYSKSRSYREEVPSHWSQDPCAPHKHHQPQLEQNGFNQLRHPHSPGSGATKRLGSCPQRTVRLMCPSTLQGPGSGQAGGEAGGREGGNGGWLEHRKAKGPWPVLVPQGLAPVLLLPTPWLEKGHGKRQGSKSQQQEKQQQLFPSPINILHYQARREGWEAGLGWAGRGRSCHLCRWD